MKTTFYNKEMIFIRRYRLAQTQALAIHFCAEATFPAKRKLYRGG